MSAPHDQPDARGLVIAVREFLATDVEPQADGRLRYHVRVAMHALGIVDRELALAEEHAARHLERLQALGFRTDQELAWAIRNGQLDDRLGDLVEPLRGMVADKLAVARPGYDSPVSEAS